MQFQDPILLAILVTEFTESFFDQIFDGLMRNHEQYSFIGIHETDWDSNKFSVLLGCVVICPETKG